MANNRLSTVNEAEAALCSLLLPFDEVFLVGSSPGSGKTTALRSLIKAHKRLYGEAQSPSPLAITSIGQGSAASEVYIYQGMLAATAESLVKECDFTTRVRHTTGMNTSLGEVVVLEALSDGVARLAGPTMNSQTQALCRYLKDECSAARVLVDGAVNRRTFSVPGERSATVFCAGASYHMDVRKASDDAVYFCRLMNLPVAERDMLAAFENEAPQDKATLGNTTLYRISGALTPKHLEDIMGNGDGKAAIIVRDAGKILIPGESLERSLRRGLGIYVEHPGSLAAVVINPQAEGYAFNARAFAESIRGRVETPVFDVIADIALL